MKIKHYLISLLIILFLVSSVAAGPFTPTGDMWGMSRYQILNFTNLTLVNSTFCFNGDCKNSWPNVSSYYNKTEIDNQQLVQNNTIDLKALPGNCSIGQVVQNTTQSGVECINLSSATVNSVGRGFGFNYSGTNITSSGVLDINDSVFQRRVGASCTTGIGLINIDGSVSCSAPQGNDTESINSLNASLNNETTGRINNDSTKITIGSDINWTTLINYPVACTANNFMTQVGDTITCTSVQEVPLSLLIDNNLTVKVNAVFNTTNTSGVVTFVDASGQTRHLGNMAQHISEMQINTLLDKSRSTLTNTASGLNYTLIAVNGAGQWNLNGTIYPNDGSSVTNASVILLNGTDISPKSNYVHFYLDGGVPALTTTEAYPSYDHIDVASFIVGKANATNSTVYVYNRNRYEIDSFVSRVLERFEASGTLYVSGFTTGSNTTNVNISTGEYFGNNIFDFTTTNNVSVINGFYYINGSGSFIQCNSLRNITQYSDGVNFSGGVNERVNIVWGVIGINTTYGLGPTQVRLVAVMPTYQGLGNEYKSVASAIADNYDTINYYPPNSVVKAGFVPIARTILRPGTDVNEPFATGIYHKFIAGAISSSGSSPVSTSSNHATLDNLDYSVSGHTGFATSTDVTSLNSSNTTTNVRIDSLNLSKVNVGSDANITLNISNIRNFNGNCSSQNALYGFNNEFNYCLDLTVYNDTALITIERDRIDSLNTSNTTTNTRIDSLNTTKANKASPTFTGTAIFDKANFTGVIYIVNITQMNSSGPINATIFYEGGVTINSKYNDTVAINSLNTTIISLNTSNTTTNARIDSINISKLQNASAANFTTLNITKNMTLSANATIVLIGPLPRYIWYVNSTLWECINSTGRIQKYKAGSTTCN
jgi:hypothetical protein